MESRRIHHMENEKLKRSTTTDGKPAAPGMENAGAPKPIDPVTGQHGAYWVLSEAERAKGFVRPVRRTYKHVGTQPTRPTRELTAEEKERYAGCDYVLFEATPAEGGILAGRFWTAARLKSRCGTSTTMGVALAETYAREPGYYGATFCASCGSHFPVGAEGEFVWEGTSEKVGT